MIEFYTPRYFLVLLKFILSKIEKPANHLLFFTFFNNIVLTKTAWVRNAAIHCIFVVKPQLGQDFLTIFSDDWTTLGLPHLDHVWISVFYNIYESNFYCSKIFLIPSDFSSVLSIWYSPLRYSVPAMTSSAVQCRSRRSFSLTSLDLWTRCI